MGIGCCCKKHEESGGVSLASSINEELKCSNRLEALANKPEIDSDNSKILISTLVDLPFKSSVSTRISILKSLKIRIFGKKLSANSLLQIVENMPYSNGFYTGQLLNGLRSGLGRMQIGSSCYTGEWENDMPSGLGLLDQIAYDSSYTGSFLNGQYNGYGEYKTSEGYYKGNWLNGKKHGKGKEKVVDYYYSGSFKHGKKCGDGELKHGGRRFVGVFKKNQLIEGEATGLGGVAIKGTWHNSVLTECDIFINEQLSISFPSLSNSKTAILKLSGCPNTVTKVTIESDYLLLELIN